MTWSALCYLPIDTIFSLSGLAPSAWPSTLPNSLLYLHLRWHSQGQRVKVIMVRVSGMRRLFWSVHLPPPGGIVVPQWCPLPLPLTIPSISNHPHHHPSWGGARTPLALPTHSLIGLTSDPICDPDLTFTRWVQVTWSRSLVDPDRCSWVTIGRWSVWGQYLAPYPNLPHCLHHPPFDPSSQFPHYSTRQAIYPLEASCQHWRHQEKPGNLSSDDPIAAG